MSDSESDPDYQPSYSSQSASSSDESSSHSEEDGRPIQPRAPTPTSNWYQSDGSRQKQFPLDIQPGINVPNDCDSELSIYRLFLTEDVMDLMVNMTNCYANKTLTLNRVTRNMRLSKWTDCTPEEMLKFLGLLIYMGLKKLPRISDYWSKNILYESKVCRQVMSRNRFELLLRCWHFEDTIFLGPSHADRLIRIRRFLELLTKNFHNVKTPGEYVTIDESMVAFRGRISFMQYIPGKRHKYGIKLFKLCDDDGYALDIIVYEGKTANRQDSVATDVVMKLCQPYLGVGRSVVTDNFYTSVDLAKKLLDNNTHLIGTLRKNRKGLPKKVIQEKLKKGEMIAMENSDGILVLKWKDKREVFALSTKHSIGFVSCKSKRNPNKTVLKHKCSIDLSDQLASYSSPARRNIRWFQKLAVDLLFSTAVTNAYITYKKHKNLHSKTYTITKFRENLCLQMLGIKDSNPAESSLRQPEHKFSKSLLTDHRSRLVRRRCIHCYEKHRSAGFSALEARNKTKKVNTVCLKCPSQPSVCAECYGEIHTQITKRM
ncbi:piggyBac transposable element-derived protein 4-like [Amyelois transitella]|uniref:piggyBac transposable element-derived protein 4-like n=1 Tax=Amyelois transitella TaxID=680683 RepID=UPI00298FA8F4|nr:piggyBac transposable element-derived protein 4-like [Amyelois transitella]